MKFIKSAIYAGNFVAVPPAVRCNYKETAA